jgi:hypothetical protein
MRKRAAWSAQTDCTPFIDAYTALKSQAHSSAAAGCVQNVNCCVMSGGNLANECQSDAATLTLSREKWHEYLNHRLHVGKRGLG